MAAGWGMGGSLTTGRAVSIGGSNGVNISGSGIHIGGANGVYVGVDGISIGGRNGIYVGPEGIRIGASDMGYITAVEEDWAQIPAVAGIIPIDEEAFTQADGDTSRQYIDLEAFTRAEVNISFGDITVAQGDSYGVEFQNNVEGYELYYRFEGSTLTIESRGEESHIWGVGSVTDARAAVTIVVPGGADLTRLDLHSDLGDVTAGDFDRMVPEVVLTTDLGDVTWLGGQVRELNAESSLGDVTVMLPDLEKVGYELSTSLGEIIVDNEVMTKENVNYKPQNAESYVRANSDLGDIYLGAY